VEGEGEIREERKGREIEENGVGKEGGKRKV
jgi:hypothetical protein